MAECLELHVICKKLKNLDDRGSSDPIVVAFDADGSELGRTEYIVDCLHPKFNIPININYDADGEGDTPVTFKVYDVDAVNKCSEAILEESRLLGYFETSVKAIVNDEHHQVVGHLEPGIITIRAKWVAPKVSSSIPLVPAPPPAPKPSRPEPSSHLLESYRGILASKTLPSTYIEDCKAEFGDNITDLVEKIHSRRNMFDCNKFPDHPFADSWEEKWSSKEPSRDQMGEQLVNQLIEELKASGKKFVDPHFPPCDASLFHDPTEGLKNQDVQQTFRKDKDPFLAGVKDIEWKRPNEIGNPKSKPVVFSGTISPDDVAQGRLGNCYFLAALAGCAEGSNDVLIKDLIIEEGMDYGLYGVKFYVAGRWTTVVVDDMFPCTKLQGYWKPIFASPKEHLENIKGEKELWAMIFEKAWAKLHHNYETTASGFTKDAANYQTAGINSEITLGTDLAEPWSRMAELTCNDENLLFLSTGLRGGFEADHLKAMGLVNGHAYSVLAAKETSSGLKMVQVRNPWGHAEWKGDYSDKSALWTPELRAELNADDEEDGSFWMTWTDFTRYFGQVHVCDPRMFNKMYEDHIARIDGVCSQWVRNKTAGGRPCHPTFEYNPQFELTVDGPEVYLTLFQPDTRSTYPKEPLEWMEMHLYLIEEEKKPREALQLCWERQKSICIQVTAGRKYKLVATSWGPGVEGSFSITACGHDCTLTPLPFTDPPTDAASKMAKQASRKPVCMCCGGRLGNGSYFDMKEGMVHSEAKCAQQYEAEHPGSKLRY